MDSNSNPPLKGLETETLTGDENEIKTIHDVAELASNESKFPISELSKNDAGAPANIFTDDILPEIFDNLDILSAQDLLNFRLVNRCWRDSATSILLKRNLCEIILDFDTVTTDYKGNVVYDVVRDWEDECLRDHFFVSPLEYCNAYNPSMFLKDLNQLISTSLKFPSASIRFHLGCGSMILHPQSEWPQKGPYHKDLLQYFALYGTEIRELSLGYDIPIKALQNLLYVQMPHLTCLNIDNLSYSFPKTKTLNGYLEENPMQASLFFPPTLRIKSISVGLCATVDTEQVEFLKYLIGACPNLRAIYCVEEAALKILIEMKKYHLIKELMYSNEHGQTQVSEQVAKLVKDTIFIKKLPNFQLSQYSVFPCYIERYGLDWLAMNIFLSASKESLKYLELRLRSSRNILSFFVPPLPYLEFLELNDLRDKWQAGSQFRFVGDVIGRAIKSGELTTNKVVSNDVFEALVLRTVEINNIPADYFPRLRKVRMYLSNNYIQKGTKKLMGFFSLEHLGPDGVTTVPGDIVPTVTTLEFGTFPCDVGYMPKLFPNVTHLNFHSSSSRDLTNWVWTAFPKLKRLEISESYFENNWDAETVDCFFTGIPQESRKNCYGKVKSSKLGLDTENGKDVERTQSYIGDCENVKEFKIQFGGKYRSQFASASVYGFQKNTQRTKIILSILSFLDPQMNSEEIEETLRKLEHVTAYVEIRSNK